MCYSTGSPVVLLQHLETSTQQHLRVARRCLPLSKYVCYYAVRRLPGFGIVYAETVTGAPPVLRHLLTNSPAIWAVTAFLTLRFIPIPFVRKSERFLVRKSRSVMGIYHVVVRYGYMDKVDHGPAFVSELVSCIVTHLTVSVLMLSKP